VPKVEKPEPKKMVEKLVEPKPEPTPKPKPKPLRSAKPVYTPELEEATEPPSPKPVQEAPRETHDEPIWEEPKEAPAAPPTRRHAESENVGESHKRNNSNDDDGEDTSNQKAAIPNIRKYYPPAALERGWEGEVKLNIHVLADGDIGEVIVLNSSGHEILDDAAVEMVKNAHATPARRGNKPVDTWETLTYRFKKSK